jgi:hypothetical protein
MHVLQWITVQTDDKDQAFRSVKDYLENQMGDEYNLSSWYDWFITGGGRWNPNEASQYDDNDQSMVLSYDESPKEFRTIIANMISNRVDEFNGYRKQYEGKEIDLNTKLDSYTGEMQYDLELYPLKKMIDMIQGNWDYNSYFFDMQHESTNTKYMFESIDSGNKNWYAVPVDFHF